MRWIAFALLWIAASPRALNAEDWPQWRGPRGDGTWNGPAIAATWPAQGPDKLWSVDIGGGYSGVTTSDGRVYTMDRRIDPRETERVLCYSAAGGKLLWSREYPADYGRLPYGNGPRASVTIHQGVAYSFGAVGHLHALDAATGKVIWAVDAVAKLDARRPEWGFAASPVIHQDRVLIHIGAERGGCVVALDLKTGREIWRGGDDAAGYCTPMILRHRGAEQCVIWGPNRLISLDPATGRTYWKFDDPIRFGVSIASPIFHEDLLLVSNYWHGTRALKLGQTPEQAQLAWSDQTLLRGLMSQPLYREGRVFLLDKDHGLTCFELATGRKLWDDDNQSTPAGHNPQASLVWTGREEQALILNSDGALILAELTPQGVKFLAKAAILDKTWAHPGFSGDQVFARSDKKLVAVRLPTIPAE